MLDYCRGLAGDDERIEFRDETGLDGVLRVFAEHDVVVIPSRWETNANTAREALTVGRPVLATPTGGLIQIIEEGVNGWLTGGIRPRDIAEAIERLLDDRSQVDRLVGSDALLESLSRSVRNDEALGEYLAELDRPLSGSSESVSVGMCTVGPGANPDALECRKAMPWRSCRPVRNRHPASSRPAGGRSAPRRRPRYATTWADAEEPWHARPLGNAVSLVDTEDCGGAVLVVRRAHAQRAASRVGATELAGGGAWLLARELRADGEYGVIVQEELVRLRNLPGWLDTESRRTEVEAALRRERTRWPARAAA